MAATLVLTLETADGPGQSRRLEQGAMTIGRSVEADWTIPELGAAPSLSRKHCRIEAAAEGFTIEDLNSTNGTYLDDAGAALAPHETVPLADGGRIRLGRHRFTVRLERAAAPFVVGMSAAGKARL